MKNSILAGLALAFTLATSVAVAGLKSGPKSVCCDASKCKTACCKVACCDAPCCAHASKRLSKADKKVMVALTKRTKAKPGSSCCSMPCCNGGACCSGSCCASTAKPKA